MFAEATKVYRELSNIARDSEDLQLDVHQLLSWASKWQLRFNPGKCEVLRITHKRDLSLSTYSLGASLKSVKHVKDLGITVSSDLSWSEKVNVTVRPFLKVLSNNFSLACCLRRWKGRFPLAARQILPVDFFHR